MLISNNFKWPEVKDEVQVMFDHAKGCTESSKEYCIVDNGQKKFNPTGECISVIFIVFKLKIKNFISSRLSVGIKIVDMYDCGFKVCFRRFLSCRICTYLF